MRATKRRQGCTCQREQLDMRVRAPRKHPHDRPR